MKIVLDTQEVVTLIENHITSLGLDIKNASVTIDGKGATIDLSAKKTKSKKETETKNTEPEVVDEVTQEVSENDETSDETISDEDDIPFPKPKNTKSVFD